MSRFMTRSALAVLALAGGFMYMAAGTSGQTTGQPSTKTGDWPAYAGDIKGTRYSPADQINAANFSKLEVAWRFKTDNLGTRPEFKLEGTPLVVKGVMYATGGTRRSVFSLKADTGELLWVHAEFEGERAVKAPRQLSGRGLSYWTDGKGDDRILYVTTGYRLIELNAKTGAPIPSFGKDGVVDLKVGMVTGTGQQIDLVNGEAGLHATPTVVKDTVIVGSSFKEGMTVTTHNNTKGLVRAFDVKSGQAAVDVQHDSPAGRVRQRHVGERIVGGQRQHRRLDADYGRRRGRPRVSAGRRSDVGFLRRPPARQQPVRRQPGLRRSEDRPAQVALPDRASPDLGLRPLVGAAARRRDDRRPDAQDRRAADEGNVPLRLRSHHRRADLADRGAAGAAVRRAGREDVADAAVPDQAAGVLASGGDRQRAHRLHARVEGAGAGTAQGVQERADVQSARPEQDRRTARGDDHRHGRRRHELAGRLDGSGNQHRVPLRLQFVPDDDRTDRSAGGILRHQVRARSGGAAVPRVRGAWIRQRGRLPAAGSCRSWCGSGSGRRPRTWRRAWSSAGECGGPLARGDTSARRHDGAGTAAAETAVLDDQRDQPLERRDRLAGAARRYA